MIGDILGQLSAKWWTFLLRGILALIVAACAFVLPGPTAGALVYIFAAYFLISGILALVAGFSATGEGHWWLLVFFGAVSILLSFTMMTQPGAGPLALAYLFSLWMIMSGTVEISAAAALRGVVKNEGWWFALGIITLAVGFYVIFQPGLGLLALVYTVGFYALFAGIALIGFAFRIKGLAAEHHAAA